MKPLEYKIAKLKELEALKENAAKSPEQPVVKTSPTAPDPMPDTPKSVTLVPGEPPVRKVEPRPERLKHMSAWEIKILLADGCLTPEEVRWFGTRNIPDNYLPGRQTWMRF